MSEAVQTAPDWVLYAICVYALCDALSALWDAREKNGSSDF